MQVLNTVHSEIHFRPPLSYCPYSILSRSYFVPVISCPELINVENLSKSFEIPSVLFENIAA